MERLLVRGMAVSLFSLVIVGSEAEEEKMEAGELSFTESEGETRTSRKRIIHTFKCLFSVQMFYLYLGSP